MSMKMVVALGKLQNQLIIFVLTNILFVFFAQNMLEVAFELIFTNSTSTIRLPRLRKGCLTSFFRRLSDLPQMFSLLFLFIFLESLAIDSQNKRRSILLLIEIKAREGVFHSFGLSIVLGAKSNLAIILFVIRMGDSQQMIGAVTIATTLTSPVQAVLAHDDSRNSMIML